MPHQCRRRIFCAVLGGCLSGLTPTQVWAEQPSGQAPQKAMFNTKAEAEAAAPAFHCTGAHPMGKQWMPCSNHGAATGGHGTAMPMTP